MVRRRQSLNTKLDHLTNDTYEQDDFHRRQQQQQQQRNHQYFPAANRDVTFHSSPTTELDLLSQGTSTAIAIPSSEEVSSSLSSYKVSPSNFPNGGASGRGSGTGGLGGAKNSKGSQRSDSVALSQAEGGTFRSVSAELQSIPLLDTHHAHSPRFATSFPPVRISMTSILRNWTSRRIFFALICGFVFFTLILSPSNQRKQVLSKAGKAWEQGWDKAEDVWDEVRKAKGIPPSGLKAPSPNRPLSPIADIPSKVEDHDDVEPHPIAIPPLRAGEVVKEASLLDAVRKKPALHAEKGSTTRCESNGGMVVDWRGVKRPVVQYAIMIDAGSTGSRVHVYKFNFCNSSPELEDEVFQMIQGGLSQYKADARGAALSLKPLMETAMDAVPPSLRGCTPIAVKATAGLRLLGTELSYKILGAVRDMLENEYPFPIADGREAGHRKGVEIMEGKDEGVFAWITVNYLLNRIGSDPMSSEEDKSEANKVKTAAVMDLGGASTQIVFEPVHKNGAQGMHPGEHVYELSNFGGKKYTLYQNSYLGYGLMEARKSINSLSLFTYGLTHPNMIRLGQPPKALTGELQAGALDNIQIPSPCFAEGKTKKTPVRMQGSKEEIEVKMVGTAGGYEACKRLVEVMMDKDA